MTLEKDSHKKGAAHHGPVQVLFCRVAERRRSALCGRSGLELVRLGDFHDSIKVVR